MRSHAHFAQRTICTRTPFYVGHKKPLCMCLVGIRVRSRELRSHFIIDFRKCCSCGFRAYRQCTHKMQLLLLHVCMCVWGGEGIWNCPCNCPFQILCKSSICVAQIFAPFNSHQFAAAIARIICCHFQQFSVLLMLCTPCHIVTVTRVCVCVSGKESNR